MSKVTAVIGNKGGTGKTTISHMVCHGLGLLNKFSVSLLTDIHRDKVSKSGRNYLPFDARTEEGLEAAIKKLRLASDTWFGVIDGGGNRPEMDQKLAEVSDLVLLPFRDSHEDIRTVIRDLERFPNSFALPSQWPTNPWELKAANQMVTELMKPYHDRVMEPVFRISAAKVLLQEEVPTHLPAQLNTACRQLALQIMMMLDMGLDNSNWKPLEVKLTPPNKQAALGKTVVPLKKTATK